jgi:hypothetical protein
MRKSSILIFTLLLAVLTVGSVIFIQSSAFARILKRAAVKYIPKNIGIDGDFSNLSVQLFPPGIAFVNPIVNVSEKNIADLPSGTHVEAERMELSFRPFQMLSGRVSIHEVKVVNGFLKTAIIPRNTQAKKKKSGVPLSWDDLIEVKAENIVLENMRVDLSIPASELDLKFNAKRIDVESQVKGKHLVYDLFIHLDALDAQTPKDWPYPHQLDSLRVNASLDQDSLQLKEFELVREGTQVIADGQILGDVLKGVGLKADLNLKLMGDMGLMLDFLSQGKKTAESSSKLPTGHIKFEGKTTVELDRPQETLTATGNFTGENVKYMDYQFDRIQVEGAYIAGQGSAGEIQVKKALLEGEEKPKNGGKQLGSGGKVELGAFNYQLGSSAPLEVDAKIERAHIHWLGAALLESFYSLDGRISGDLKIKFTPPTETQAWLIQAHTDWGIQGLQLDNQRHGKIKPLNRIFLIPQTKLVGDVTVNENRVSFTNMTVSSAATQLTVEGGIGIGKKTEFDIKAVGPIDFADFTTLVENDIKGKGGLAIHVHGPGDQVQIDFDGDLTDFYYLRLHFGGFNGRITWDDAPSMLRFKNIQAIKNRTRYVLQGNLNLLGEETMELSVGVPSGNINDFFSIFQDLTKQFEWFPQTLTGDMKGSMKLYGGLALSKMKVDASIQGASWEYLGERFRTVNLQGGYDEGKYFISQFQGLKRTGLVNASISYDTKEILDWSVSTEGLALLDIDHLARLDVPIRGKLTAQSKGKGKMGSIESMTRLRADEVAIRGRAQAPSYLNVQTKNGKATFQGEAVGGQATLDAYYDFTLGNACSIKAEAKNLDFTPIVLLLNPSLLDDQALLSRVSGSYQIGFQSGKFETGSGFFKVEDYLLAKTGTYLKLEKPLDVRIERGTFQITDVSLSSDEGRLSADLRSEQGFLNGQIRGALDLGITEFVTSSVAHGHGLIRMDLKMSGSVKEPLLEGAGKIQNGVIKLASLETPLENIEGRFTLSKWIVRLNEMEADLAGGRATAEGEVELYADRYPRLNLGLNLSGNKIKVFPFQVVKVRGKLGVRGTDRPYLVDGRIFIDNALSREKIANSRGPTSRSAQYTPPPSATSNSDFPLFKLDIAVSAPGNVIIQNELVDLEAKGELKIVNTLDNPRPMGLAQAIQGKILFKDRAFQIQSGTMEFDSPATINPRFEVLATTELNNRKIQMFAAGRLDRYKIEFSSNPPMPENEILSFLALGVSSDDSRRLRMTDRSAYEQGEAASLVLHSLDFNREVQNKTGLQIGIDEATDQTAANSAFRSRAETDTNAASPKIVIRRQLGPRVGLSVGSTVGVGASTQQEVNAEVQVTRRLSVQGVWNRIETANQDEPGRSSYGVDLKVQKRFK